MLAILNVTIPFFALVLCGYLAARGRRLPLEAIAPLNGFVLYFALPSLLFRFVANSPFSQIANAPIFIAYGLTGMLVFALVATLLRRLNRDNWRDTAFGAMAASWANWLVFTVRGAGKISSTPGDTHRATLTGRHSPGAARQGRAPHNPRLRPITTDTIDWYNVPLFLGLSSVNLGLAALVAIASYLAMTIALRVARNAAARLSGHAAGEAAGAIGEILSGTSSRLMILTALLIGVGTLDLAEPWSSRASHLWFLTLMLQVALWANRAITLGLSRYFRRHAGPGAQASASSTLLSWALRTILWTVALLAVLSNVGVNITAFIASLGIGGVAVALAVQNILGDLFASLSIAVDKPFEVGDAIGVGGISGSVEYVGLKSTRIRSIGGEQVIMSNTDLLKQTVSNYKRMATRRVVFTFGVTYDTTPDQAEAIPGIVKAIIESSEKLRFGRAHFKGFGDSALNYEVVYTVLVADYDLFMDLQQMINLQLMRELKKLDVGFAFPTRTVHLAGPAATDDRAPNSFPAETSPRDPVPGHPPATALSGAASRPGSTAD